MQLERKFPKNYYCACVFFPESFDLSHIIVDRKDDMFSTEIYYIVKILALSFQNEQFCLKNTVLQNLYTHGKDSVTHQNQSTSVDQIWVLGCWYLFQGKQTFKISTFLPDSKQTKFWQSCLFSVRREGCFTRGFAKHHWGRNYPHVWGEGRFFSSHAPHSVTASWEHGSGHTGKCPAVTTIPSPSHPSPCVLLALRGLEATQGSPKTHAAKKVH